MNIDFLNFNDNHEYDKSIDNINFGNPESSLSGELDYHKNSKEFLLFNPEKMSENSNNVDIYMVQKKNSENSIKIMIPLEESNFQEPKNEEICKDKIKGEIKKDKVLNNTKQVDYSQFPDIVKTKMESIENSSIKNSNSNNSMNNTKSNSISSSNDSSSCLLGKKRELILEEEELKKEEKPKKNDKKARNYNSSRRNKNPKKPTRKNPNCGRKKKESMETGIHTKISEDNIIQKIKTKKIKIDIDEINSRFKFTKERFFRIDSKIAKYNKRDKNLSLYNTKYKEILKNSKVSKKYVDKEDHNKKLIEKIYREGIETDVIEFLEKTYGETMDIQRFKTEVDNEKFRNYKKIDYIIEEIIQKAKKNKESDEFIKEYVISFVNLFYNFYEWFEKKDSRNRKNKNDED